MMDDWKADLLQEKNLLGVFKASLKLKRSKFNDYAILLSLISALLPSLYFIYKSDVMGSAELVAILADICFNFTVQMLGFLIGGFAILATLSNPSLMTNLAQTPMGDGGISVFKSMFFNFLSVFCIYVSTLSFSIIVKIVSKCDAAIVGLLFSHDMEARILSIFNCFIVIIVTFLLAVSLTRLKSFIWNIYQALLTVMIADHVMKEQPDQS